MLEIVPSMYPINQGFVQLFYFLLRMVAFSFQIQLKVLSILKSKGMESKDLEWDMHK